MTEEYSDEQHRVELSGRLFSRLMQFVKPYVPYVLTAAIMTIALSAFVMVIPYLTKLAIDENIAVGDKPGFMRVILILCGLYLANWAVSSGRIYLMSWIGQKVIYDLRTRIFAHLQVLSLKYFDKLPAGKILTRLTSDVDALNEMVSSGVVTVIGDTVTLIGTAAIMVWIDAPFALATFCLIPGLVYMSTGFNKKLSAAERDVRAKASSMNAFLQENISGIRVTQAFVRENVNAEKFSEINGDNYNANLREAYLFSFFWPVIDFIWVIGTVIVLWYGSSRVLGHHLSVGVIVAFTAYIGNFFGPIRNLSQIIRTLQRAMAGAQRIFELLDNEPDVQDREGAHELSEMEGKVEFKDVTFAYEGDNYVLNGINLTAMPGETVALVGHTGAGKTSIINLLCRFYDVNSGAITIDGCDIRDLKLEYLRNSVGLVLQEPFLFTGSVKDNLLYGRPDASNEEMELAAKAVNAHDFITRMKNGYDTELEERGGNLSSGQKQLLSFARALIKNPRILILDEATSNIDTETEKKIQSALRTLLKGRTSFVIAHRLSTIMDADKIAVIDGGRIVECGTHDELLAAGGYYCSLYESQFKFSA